MTICENCSLDEIIVLHRHIYGEDFPVESYRKKCNDNRKLMHIGFFVDEELVGYCIVLDISAEKRLHAWVGGTLPKYQGQGFFSAFYDWLIQQATKMEYTCVTGNTDNYKPHMLYILIKKGFDIIGVEKTMYGDGIKILFKYTIYKPLKMRLCITNYCNLNCFFCHHEGVVLDANTALSLPDIEKILIQAKKANLKELTITGGEPATYFPAIHYILRYCNGWGTQPHIKIATNGLLWTAKQLDELKVYQGKLTLNISLHTIKEKTAQSIHGLQINYEPYKKLFLMLKERQIEFRINTTVLRTINDSEEDYLAILDFLLRYDVCKINFQELLVSKKQPELFPYYLGAPQIEHTLLNALSTYYTVEPLERSVKKNRFLVQNDSKRIEVSIFRLSCRSGCSNCLKEGDLIIGADGKGHPCYLEPELNCGDAVYSLRKVILSRAEFVAKRSPEFSYKKLYWED